MTKDSPFLPIQTAFQNVVSLDQVNFADNPGRYPACRDLRAYWEALRAGRQMPARSEFDPRGIEETLACTFVAEKVAPSVARIRVAGSVMSEALGMDVRGMPITAFIDPESRDALSEATRDMLASPALVEIELTARRGFGRKPVHARMLLLPMSDAEGDVTRIVGCLDIDGGLGKTPRRFQIAGMRRVQLEGEAPLPAANRKLFAQNQKPDRYTNQPQYEFAEMPSEFRSQRRDPKPAVPAKTNLRLVVSND